MALKPEASIGTGLAAAVLVFAIHSQATPTIAEMRVSPASDPDLDSARRQATWTAAAVVSGISLIARDATVFVLGGAMVIAMDWWTRYSDAVEPATGKATAAQFAAPLTPSDGPDPLVQAAP